MRRFGIILGAGVLLIVAFFGWWIFDRPERGTTGWARPISRLRGQNKKLSDDPCDAPTGEGAPCHISRAQTGGLKGGLGVAEDTSDASIACRQVGPIKIIAEFKDGERVFDERR